MVVLPFRRKPNNDNPSGYSTQILQNCQIWTVRCPGMEEWIAGHVRFFLLVRLPSLLPVVRRAGC